MKVAVIPARGGSRRIPRKNIRMFHGKPIICYSIEAAKASGLFDHIVVSTDDPEIRALALLADVSVFNRDMDDGARGTNEVTAEVLQSMSAEYACCIYPTSPLMAVEDLIRGFNRFRLFEKEGWSFAFSVGTDPLCDAGQFYWGLPHAFGHRTLIPHAVLVEIARERVCDINTEDDWRRAEEMYAALRTEPA